MSSPSRVCYVYHTREGEIKLALAARAILKFRLTTFIYHPRKRHQERNGSNFFKRLRDTKIVQKETHTLLTNASDVFGRCIFLSTLPNPRRTTGAGKCTGAEGSTDQKLVSKPEIPVEASRRKPDQTGPSDCWTEATLCCTWNDSRKES